PGDVGEGAVVVVVVEAGYAVVADVEVGPAVVVVVGDGAAVTPPIVLDSGFFGDVGKGSVVIVAEQSGVGRGLLAVEGVEGGAVDEVDVEPPIVVVVDETDAGAIGFDDEVFFGRAHLMDPAGEARLFGDVLEDDGRLAGLDEAAGSDGAVLLVVLGRGAEASGNSGHGRLLRRRRRGLWRLGGLRMADGGARNKENHARKQNSRKEIGRHHHAFAVYRRVWHRFGRMRVRGVTMQSVTDRQRSSSSAKQPAAAQAGIQGG